MISLCCKRALQKRRYSAKETCNFIDATNRSHPIARDTPSELRTSHLDESSVQIEFQTLIHELSSSSKRVRATISIPTSNISSMKVIALQIFCGMAYNVGLFCGNACNLGLFSSSVLLKIHKPSISMTLVAFECRLIQDITNSITNFITQNSHPRTLIISMSSRTGAPLRSGVLLKTRTLERDELLNTHVPLNSMTHSIAMTHSRTLLQIVSP